MLSGVANFLKKIGHSIVSVFKTPALKTNFDIKTLIPAGILPIDYPKWIEAYLKELPHLSLILWAFAGRLNLSYVENGFFRHQYIEEFEFQAVTQCIQIDGYNVSLKQLIENPSLHPKPPVTLTLISADKLNSLKYQAQLNLEFVNPALIAHIKKLADQASNNIESCSNCTICMEEYTSENPPYTVNLTQSVYHLPCFENHRKTCGMRELRDPKTNIVLAQYADHTRSADLLTKATAYLNAMREVNTLGGNTKALTMMLNVLLKKNQILEAQLAEKDTQLLHFQSNKA